MSAVATADVKAHGTTNPRDGSVVTTTITPPPLVFFCPHTAEIVVVDSKNRGPFLQEAKLLEDVVAEHMEARLASEAAQNALLGLSNHAQILDAQQALNQRINEEEAARKKMADAFKTVSPNPGKDMMELLPMWSSKVKNGLPRDKKFTYVRTEKVKNLVRDYKLPGADKSAMKSFLMYDAKKKVAVRRKKTTRQLPKSRSRDQARERNVRNWPTGMWRPISSTQSMPTPILPRLNCQRT